MQKPDQSAALRRAAEHWSAKPKKGKTKWWKSPTILSHINKVVYGEAIAGGWAGLMRRMKTFQSLNQKSFTALVT